VYLGGKAHSENKGNSRGAMEQNLLKMETPNLEVSNRKSELKGQVVGYQYHEQPISPQTSLRLVKVPLLLMSIDFKE
jgi:hypothetical protein